MAVFKCPRALPEQYDSQEIIKSFLQARSGHHFLTIDPVAYFLMTSFSEDDEAISIRDRFLELETLWKDLEQLPLPDLIKLMEKDPGLKLFMSQSAMALMSYNRKNEELRNALGYLGLEASKLFHRLHRLDPCRFGGHVIRLRRPITLAIDALWAFKSWYYRRSAGNPVGLWRQDVLKDIPYVNRLHIDVPSAESFLHVLYTIKNEDFDRMVYRFPSSIGVLKEIMELEVFAEKIPSEESLLEFVQRVDQLEGRFRMSQREIKKSDREDTIPAPLEIDSSDFDRFKLWWQYYPKYTPEHFKERFQLSDNLMFRAAEDYLRVQQWFEIVSKMTPDAYQEFETQFPKFQEVIRKAIRLKTDDLESFLEFVILSRETWMNQLLGESGCPTLATKT